MPNPRKSSLPDFRGYVQIELTEEDIGIIQSDDPAPSVALDALAAILSDGYRFSWYQEADGFSFKASLMDVDPTRSSAGYMLTGSAPSPSLALRVLLFKHLAKLGTKWTPFLGRASATHGLR